MDEAEPGPTQPRLAGAPRRDPPSAARRQAARGQLRRRVRQLRPSPLPGHLPDPGDAQAARARPPDRVGERLPPLDRPRLRDRSPSTTRSATSATGARSSCPSPTTSSSSGSSRRPPTCASVAMNLYRKQDAVGSCLDDADPLADRPVRQPRAHGSNRCSGSSPSDGTVEAVGDHLVVRDRGPTTIVVAAATDFRHDDYAAVVARTHRRGRRPWLRRHPGRSRGRAQRQDAPRQHLARRWRHRRGRRELGASPTGARLERIRDGR